MSPRSWFYLCLLLLGLITGCQPIRPVETAPIAIPAPVAVPSTTTSGHIGCPLITEQPLDLIIAPDWKQGDVRRYQASYSRTRVEDGEEEPTLTTSYAMSVTVLTANEDGFILEWRDVAMFSGPRRTRLEYSTTPYGEFIELRNVDELQEMINAYVPQLLLAPGRPLPTTDLTVIPDDVIEQAIDLITADVRAFHGIYGLYFTDKTVHFFKEAAMLPAGNIRGTNTTRILLMTYGESKGCLNLSVANEWKAIPGQLTLPYTVDSIAIFDYDINTSWPKTVRMQRSHIVDGEGQIEQLTLTYVLPAE